MADVRRRSTWSEIGKLGASTLIGGGRAGGGLADQVYRQIFTDRDTGAASAPVSPDGLPVGTVLAGSVGSGSSVLYDANPVPRGFWAYDARWTATASGVGLTFTRINLRVRDGDNNDAPGSPGPPYIFGDDTSVFAAISGTFTSYGEPGDDLYAEIDNQDTDGLITGANLMFSARLLAVIPV